jgi:hypothetical protein
MTKQIKLFSAPQNNSAPLFVFLEAEMINYEASTWMRPSMLAAAHESDAGETYDVKEKPDGGREVGG